MMSRTLARVLARQSPSFLIFSSMKSEADPAVTGFFMRRSHLWDVRYVRIPFNHYCDFWVSFQFQRIGFVASEEEVQQRRDATRSCFRAAHRWPGISDVNERECARRTAAAAARCAASSTAANRTELCAAGT